jgi:hypothetical protein
MALIRARRSALSLPAVRPRASGRRTYAIAALAATTTGAVAAAEVGRVWRRGSAPLPAETSDVLGAGAEATRQTVEVAVAGYRATPARETALINLLGSFVLSFATVRASTWTIRSRGTFGPFRDLHVGDRHIHHFVPGIAIAFVTGAAAIVTRDPELEKWLAVPYGAGVALTLDESALLLELEDVYWTERGVLSVHIALSATALLASLALGRRLLRRGEERVLPEP